MLEGENNLRVRFLYAGGYVPIGALGDHLGLRDEDPLDASVEFWQRHHPVN